MVKAATLAPSVLLVLSVYACSTASTLPTFSNDAGKGDASSSSGGSSGSSGSGGGGSGSSSGGTAAQCMMAVDCKVASNACDPCMCLPLGANEPVPDCDAGSVKCNPDPCTGHTATCNASGQCVLQ